MPSSLWERLFPSPMKHPDIIRVGWMRDNQLHNFLVCLYHLARLPLLVCALLLAAMALPAVRLFAQPLWAGAILAVAAALDLLLLLALPRLKLSFGWPQPPWLLYGAGRAALAALVGVLPLSPVAALLVLAMVQLTLTALSLYGSLVEPFWLEQTELELPLPGLGGTVTALLLTDLHLERWTRRERAVLDAVRARKPELVLLGGDLLNLAYVGDPTAMAHCREFVDELSALSRVYFVRGTVDVDPPHVVDRMLDGLPLTRVETEVCPVDLARGDGPSEAGMRRFSLVGLPAQDTPADRERRLNRLMREAQPPTLVLHHTPDLVEVAAENDAAVYLAGHTHGGQICLPLLGPLATASRFGRKYVRGAICLKNTKGYVSRGVGLEGLGAPRMRFLARPELVWLSLHDPHCP